MFRESFGCDLAAGIDSKRWNAHEKPARVSYAKRRRAVSIPWQRRGLYSLKAAAQGSLTQRRFSVTDDQGNVTTVAYDLFGRRTAINSPDAGSTIFTYDLDDNLIAKQTANLATTAQKVTFAYQFNRVTAITYPNFPANNVTYTYGAASQRNPSASGNVVGRITHITDGAGTEDRLYGPLGEIVSETRAIPIQGGQVAHYTTQFTYDTWNRMAQMRYPIEVKKLTTDQPNGEVVPYFYDFGALPERVHRTYDAL